MKRMLDCHASDFASMGRTGLLAAIAGAEGRTLVSETICSRQPLLGDISNAEFAAAMGADLLILNLFDVQHPAVLGLPACAPEDVVRKLKSLTGRPVGINLEPVEQAADTEENLWAVTDGRRATLENAKAAVEMGVDFLVLTGNPGAGVTNAAITQTLALYRKELGDRIVLIAGKMHAAGVLSEGAEAILTKSDIHAFREAGADVLLMPAPGTVPGLTMEHVRELVSCAHSLGALTMTAIGTSQEGADAETIRQIALMCKMAGTDMHHIGDSGYCGMALPENIMAYSVAIRGVRHTYRRMAASANR